MQLVPPMVIAEVGGAVCLLGYVALMMGTKLKTVLGELDAGEINSQPSNSLCLHNLVGESRGLNQVGRQKANVTVGKEEVYLFLSLCSIRTKPCSAQVPRAWSSPARSQTSWVGICQVLHKLAMNSDQDTAVKTQHHSCQRN